MKSKRGITFVLIILILAPLLFAQDEVVDPIDASYDCLKEKLGTNCGGTKNVEQIAFSLLAMAYDSDIQSDCKSALDDKKKENCWGETKNSPCSLKHTAMAIIALDNLDEDTEDAVNWILEKRKSNTGLTWFLEIDANNETVCDINGRKITINDDKKISGSSPLGLRKAYNNYWFEITDTSKNFTISCNENFVTTLLYQKPGSNVFHVSSETQDAAAHDSVTEQVNFYCFSAAGSCDYEGSLWATLALTKTRNRISSYLPYLSAMADDAANKKHFPSTFLYILTNGDDYYSDIIEKQNRNQLWDESRNQLYDTSLALLALQGTGAEEVSSAKESLLSIRETSGCWDSNTAFILYSGWPKGPTTVSGTDEPTSITYCESYGYYCVPYLECSSPLENLYCADFNDACCEEEFQEETCEEKLGVICNIDEECTGSVVPAAHTYNCCLGECEPPTVEEEENECVRAGYFCKSECFEDSQEEKVALSNSCDLFEKCCGNLPIEEKKSNWLLVILLIILIILVILAIIFRNQLKVWLFKRKSKYRTGRGLGVPRGPSMPPPGFGGRIVPQVMPGRIMPRMPVSRRPMRRPSTPRKSEKHSKKDKEFEETMKKLKEISK